MLLLQFLLLPWTLTKFTILYKVFWIFFNCSNFFNRFWCTPYWFTIVIFWIKWMKISITFYNIYFILYFYNITYIYSAIFCIYMFGWNFIFPFLSLKFLIHIIMRSNINRNNLIIFDNKINNNSILHIYRNWVKIS